MLNATDIVTKLSEISSDGRVSQDLRERASELRDSFNRKGITLLGMESILPGLLDRYKSQLHDVVFVQPSMEIAIQSGNILPRALCMNSLTDNNPLLRNLGSLLGQLPDEKLAEACDAIIHMLSTGDISRLTPFLSDDNMGKEIRKIANESSVIRIGLLFNFKLLIGIGS